MFTRHLFLRRPPRLRVTNNLFRSRLQHEQHGPHKEYFQHPSQYPSANNPGQTILSHGHVNSSQSIPTIPVVAPIPPGPLKPSIWRRATRAGLIATIFLILGYSAGTAIVTWDYLQEPIEEGSEEYEEMEEEIEEVVETSPMAESLRQDGWFEEPITQKRSPVAGTSGSHFTQDALSGVQGVTMKVFRHPTEHHTALVFFTGFGIEGWPDVVHGGLIMSMFHEAYTHHMTPIMRQEGLHSSDEERPDNQFHYQFSKPMRPGEVYTVLCVNRAWGHSQNQETGQMYVRNATHSYMLSADALPSIHTESNTLKTDIFLNFESSRGVVHAASDIHSDMVKDRIEREEGESNDDYLARCGRIMQEFYKRRGLD